MPRAAAILALLTAVVATAAHSQANCPSGIKYDDGTFENAYGWPESEDYGQYALRFDLPQFENRLGAVCICLTRSGTDSSIQFDLEVWDSNGFDGEPGSELGVVEGVQATAVPVFPATKWYRVPIPGGMAINSDAIYVGPLWRPNQDRGFFVCGDENGPTMQRAYGDDWTNLSGAKELGTDIYPNYRALGVRAEVAALTGPCVPSDTTMCLRDGRFQVRMLWNSPTGQRNALVKGFDSAQSGIFYFNNQDNAEVLLKVLSGCALNDYYWVFFSATTNVGFQITVTDLQSSLSRTYTNLSGQAAQSIQDTTAFATCP